MNTADMKRMETLCDPLLKRDGTRITTPKDWAAYREQWKQLLIENLWGSAPDSADCRGEIVSSHLLYSGRAVMETVRITYGADTEQSFDACVIRPNREGRFPAVVWCLFDTPFLSPCPIEEEAIERGYILAGFSRVTLMNDGESDREAAKRAYPDYGWNAIRIWAFGYSLLASYLLTRNEVDGSGLIAAGHSRCGKAALAAGVLDERFRVCAPINSGAGGAGCFRFLGDEHGLTQDFTKTEGLSRIAYTFPHWWPESFLAYGDRDKMQAFARESELPFDMHIAKALVAPRAILSCEGLQDTWANPYGTYLTWKAAQPVFALLGVPENNGIFYREGGHCFSDADWRALLDFCDGVLGRGAQRAFNQTPYHD